MRINFYSSIEQTRREALAGGCVIIIDVLRACSTIIAALDSGAERVIPIADAAAASTIVRPTERDRKLLAGERKGVKIEGFDLGNSPLEFTPDKVRGKTIVLSTSNGTRAMALAAKASKALICSLANLGAVAKAASGEEEISILCCGTEGAIASEDLLCGGMLVEMLGVSEESAGLNDAAKISLLLAEHFRGSVQEFIRNCDHGKALRDLGFEADIVACSSLDSSQSVPVLREGSISSNR